MRIPEETINEIKYKNEIEQIIAPYVNLKRRGKNLVGLCPFHGEKTPSFTVYPENGSFYCFGCGVGGDIFTFTKLIENLDYIEAVKLLAERSGITIAQDSYDDSMQRLKSNVFEINRETAHFYHSYLMSVDGKWALDYLKQRGLALSTIKHFGIGAAPDSWDSLINHLKSKGYSLSDMVQANVVGKNQSGRYYDRFRNRVMFPIINIRGKVIGFSGRARPNDDKAGAKYVNTSDTVVYKKSENLFGMNFAKNFCDEQIILVEGNLDVISLHQAGFQNAVAALGTSFTDEQANLISRYTKEIVLCLDADAAGQKAVKRAGEILKKTGLSVRVISVPEGKDPDEYIKKHGADRFAALLKGAVSEIEYKLLTAVEGIDVNSDDGKLQYLAKAAQIIAECNDAMARDLYIGRLSSTYEVAKSAIEAKVNEIRSTNVKRQKRKEIADIITPKYTRDDLNPERRSYPAAVSAEEAVIAVIMQHPDLIEKVQSELTPDDMFSNLHKRIYSTIIECYSLGRAIDISYFGDILSSGEIGYLVSLLNSEKGGKNASIVLKDSIKVILDESLKKKALSVSDTTNDDWEKNLKELIKNKQKGN